MIGWVSRASVCFASIWLIASLAVFASAPEVRAADSGRAAKTRDRSPAIRKGTAKGVASPKRKERFSNGAKATGPGDKRRPEPPKRVSGAKSPRGRSSRGATPSARDRVRGAQRRHSDRLQTRTNRLEAQRSFTVARQPSRKGQQRRVGQAAKPVLRRRQKGAKGGRQATTAQDRTFAVRRRRRGRWAPVELFYVNRKERMMLRIADNKGRPIRAVHKRAARFLRCHYTNQQHRIHPRLIRLIYRIGRRFDGSRLEIISGYRHSNVSRLSKSRHKEGRAVDLRVRGIPNRILRDYLLENVEKVGVGYYPNSGFVHVDIRDQGRAFWIDYSGPRQRAIYADDPWKDLRTGRSERYKPKRIDPAWAHQENAQEDASEKQPPGQDLAAPLVSTRVSEAEPKGGGGSRKTKQNAKARTRRLPGAKPRRAGAPRVLRGRTNRRAR